jgi:hypothetical protein
MACNLVAALKPIESTQPKTEDFGLNLKREAASTVGAGGFLRFHGLAQPLLGG